MKTLTKNNEVSAYGYACGHTTKIDSPKTMTDYEINYVSLSLYREHGVYMVSFYNRNKPEDTFKNGFYRLAEAKKVFNQYKTAYAEELNISNK